MPTTRRKICISTGKRGGFGALLPVMRMIDGDPSLELQVIVTDMHLNETFGYTVQEVQRYVRIAEQVSMDQKGDSATDRAQALGRCISGMATALDRLRPDIVVLLGDRSETLATAFTCIEMGIPLAHIQAGDQSGGLDDIHRAAITKLSHLHFSQTEQQGKRVLALGEEPWRVTVSGAPYIDRIIAGQFTDAATVRSRFNLDPVAPTFVVLQHPDTYEPHNSYASMRATLDAMKDLAAQAVVCYPCSDQGYAGVIRAIEEFKDEPGFRIEQNVDSVDFLGLLAIAGVMVGNSSSAIIEAPYFNLPAVNVGNRQRGRERGANVIDVEPSREAISAGLRKAASPKFLDWLREQPRPFGDGSASEKIVEILRSVTMGPKLFEKPQLAT
jgi:GDP/UDP-N,N'-diacetylbacillosamine 2-epimerase (hydrolysing)